MLRATSSRAMCVRSPVATSGACIAPTRKLGSVDYQQHDDARSVRGFGRFTRAAGGRVAYDDRQRRGFGTRQISPRKKEMQKNARKTKDHKKASNEEKLAFMTKILDAKPPPKPVLTPEEKQRNMEIGKRYNKMMAKEHNDRMADYTLKIRLRDDAINNLPELLQHAARQKDTNPPPTNRRMFSFTPPIPGYNPRDYVKEEESDDLDIGAQEFEEGESR